MTRFLSWGPNREQDTRDFLEHAIANAAAEPRRHFELGLVLHATGELVGGCGVAPGREGRRELEIGYCLRRDVWGRGLGGEAVRAIVEFAFDALGAHRVCARVDPMNVASRRLLERVGFRLEDHLRKDTLVRGEWRDSLVFAVLDERRGVRGGAV